MKKALTIGFFLLTSSIAFGKDSMFQGYLCGKTTTYNQKGEVTSIEYRYCDTSKPGTVTSTKVVNYQK